jgi:hypothetical protein
MISAAARGLPAARSEATNFSVAAQNPRSSSDTVPLSDNASR